jgi:hypothetical protein
MEKYDPLACPSPGVHDLYNFSPTKNHRTTNGLAGAEIFVFIVFAPFKCEGLIG